MKILSCCPLGYYSKTTGTSYEYLSFVEALRQMGHGVHHYDYRLAAGPSCKAMNDFVLSIVKHGGYDLVIIVTRRDEFFSEVLDEAKRHCVLLAWNCDDDWKWEEYSSHWVTHYTYMVTTCRHIYEANTKQHENLLLSQWACTGFQEGINVPKDIDISFVGLCYGQRKQQVERLRNELGLVAYGRKVKQPETWRIRWKKRIAYRLGIPWHEEDRELPDQNAVKDLWNRSKISFTPLEASRSNSLQIKARVFDMGLSGTVMLCSKNPALYEFYEPGKEFLEFESMDECVNKARYYLAHEPERRKIAESYYHRTKSEHLWHHRFEKLFKEIGLV